MLLLSVKLHYSMNLISPFVGFSRLDTYQSKVLIFDGIHFHVQIKWISPLFSQQELYLSLDLSEIVLFTWLLVLCVNSPLFTSYFN
jgi:hypothetical protein